MYKNIYIKIGTYYKNKRLLFWNKFYNYTHKIIMYVYNFDFTELIVLEINNT